MTIQEASGRYQIPLQVLREYENWGLRGATEGAGESRQYDDADLGLLSVVMTLREIGFSPRETEAYLRLLLEGERSGPRRLHMLEEKRCAVLEEIHGKERQLQKLDYLRHELRKAQRETESGGP